MGKFFKVPFAEVGDKQVIPNNIQGDGSVSFTEGFGQNYSADPNIYPNALKVPRDSSNELFYDITEALQQYQTHGAPDFITTADNEGSPYPYDIWALVRYDDGSGFQIYQSLVNANITLPTSANNWRNVTSGLTDSKGVYIENAVFDGAVFDRDVVYWDSGSGTFKPAFGDGSISDLLIGMADIPNSRVLLVGEISGPFYGSAGLQTNLLPDAVYYMSNINRPGHITQTPSDPNILVRLGVAKTSNTFFFFPQVLNSARAQVFTSNGNFIVPHNVKQIIVSGCGGGGGGGGGGGALSINPSDVYASGGGSGGGAGRFFLKETFVVNVGETLSISIGGGGSGGSAGTAVTSGEDGGNGGTTELLRGITVMVSAAGGTGGIGSPAAFAPPLIPAGGAGQNMGGDNGGIGVASRGFITSASSGNGGHGGTSYFGSGGKGGRSNGQGAVSDGTTADISGAGYGGGGGGGSGRAAIDSIASGSGGTGGSGKSGVLIIEW
jgi:hypothetical protein